MSALPRSLVTNPRLSQWVAFGDGRVRVSTGKVELGQGILTALTQIAADELCVDIARIDIVSGQAPVTPDEVYTAGSQSVEISGGAIALVCAQVRETLVHLACETLELDRETCRVQDGRIHAGDRATAIDYWTDAGRLELERACDGSAPLLAGEKRHYVGRPVARADLAEKLFGGGFIHDMPLDGMKHARVLRGAFRDARLAALDEDAVRRAAPVDILRIGAFTAFVADRQRDVELALAAARLSASWALETPDADAGTADWLMRQEKSTRVIQTGAEPAPSNSEIRLRFSRPYLSHGSIGPSCGIARFDGGRLDVWTHSQGVAQLRTALATVLGMDVGAIAVMHRHGAGCYGHNGADDAACDAALIALRYPGVPIRVLWSRSDELSAAPLGAAMVAEASATLADDGAPRDWKLEIWSGSHGQRPGMAGRPNLLAAEEAGLAQPAADILDVPDMAGGGGTRNAVSPYDLPGQTITHNLITRPTPHTSALRGLGTQVNVVAIEAMMDTLAETAGIDLVEYRLRFLPDPRARRILARCAELCGWSERGEAGTGTGFGIAYSRYKNHAAHLALAARVEIDEEVRLTDIWCVADAGLVINPDGAANQIEGGIIQAASWTLKEAFALGDERTVSRGWPDYPILRFPEVPEITLEMIDAPDLPPLGVGEVAVGPTSAAIANAVSHALGVRITTLPLTYETIAGALLQDG